MFFSKKNHITLSCISLQNQNRGNQTKAIQFKVTKIELLPIKVRHSQRKFEREKIPYSLLHTIFDIAIY
jgi:hypothetical protein